MSAVCSSFVKGMGVGIWFGTGSRCQETNTYSQAFFQALQLFPLRAMDGALRNLAPGVSLKLPGLKNLSFFSVLAPLLLAVAVKKREYGDCALRVNSVLREWGVSPYVCLPIHLGNRTVRVIDFACAHSNDFFKGAMIAYSVALIVFGSSLYGLGTLTMLAYSELQERELLSKKVTSYAEKVFLLVFLVNAYCSASLLMCVYGISTLTPLNFAQRMQHFYEKVDVLWQRLFGTNGPLLKEVNQPVVLQRKLSFQEINSIIGASEQDFKINPAAAGTEVISLALREKDFLEDRNFQNFLTLVESLEFHDATLYSYTLSLLKKDDRFIELLSQKFLDKTRSQLEDFVEEGVQTLANQGGLTSQEFVKRWVKDQMQGVVSSLQNTAENHEAVIYCSVALALLSSQGTPAAKECIVTIALEGANKGAEYVATPCGLFLQGLIKTHLKQNIQLLYEFELLCQLQKTRLRVLQWFYKRRSIDDPLPSCISLEDSLFSLLKDQISLGFYPKKGLNFPTFVNWLLHASERTKLYAKYARHLEDFFRGEDQRFMDYIESLLKNHETLSLIEKHQLLTMLKNPIGDAKENMRKFHRLMLVILGILEIKRLS